MSIKRWYNNQNFLRKMIYMYLLCAAVPMLLITLYNYFQTRSLLMEQAYTDMKQNMDTVGSEINLVLQPYQTVAWTLDNDRTLNILINQDYTNVSYSELVYYCRNTMDNLLALYPNVQWLRLYCNNMTLPKDNDYYYRLEHLDDDVVELVDSFGGRTVAFNGVLENTGDDILLLSRINYYASDIFKSYLVLNLRQAAIAEHLRQDRKGWDAYLLDHRGQILSATDSELIGQNYLSLYENWAALPPGQIQTETTAEGVELMYLRADLDMGTSLIMTVNQDMLLQSTKIIPQLALAGFLLLTVIAFFAVLALSRMQTRKLEDILEATQKIGGGQFDCTLGDMGRDELGQIAEAVNQMSRHINNLIHENYERQMQIQTSEMNLLQEQINPHFLYNALAVISSLAMREGGKQTVQSVRYLSNFYRMSLSKGQQMITVEEEVELLQNYMKIQMLRFSDMLEIRYEIDPAVASWQSIKLILQPLVENSICHGRQEDCVLHITVRVGCVDGMLFYEVEDDGVGIEPEKLEMLRTELATVKDSFGLRNVDIRIKLHYGKEYGVLVSSIVGEGTTVRAVIPGHGDVAKIAERNIRPN